MNRITIFVLTLGFALFQTGFAQTLPGHIDWYGIYTNPVNVNQRDNYVAAPDAPNLHYTAIGYDYPRYILQSYLSMRIR